MTHAILEAGRPFVHGLGIVIQIDENEACEFLHAHTGQTEIGLVEALHVFAVACGAQATVRAIGPGVIGAGNDGLHAALALEQLMGAMLADVVEGTKVAVAPADDKDALPVDVDRGVITWIGDLAGMADDTPGFEENLLLLLLVNLWFEVPGRRQSEGRRGIVGNVLDGEGINRGHGSSPASLRFVC